MEQSTEHDDVWARFDELVAAANGAMIAVVARSDEGVGSCLVGFHCQCSIEPRRYAVWLSKANHTYRIAAQASELAVHWLRHDQRGTAIALGGVSSDDDPQKLDRIDLVNDPSTGAPVLADCAGYFVGRVNSVQDTGDHVCFVLDVDASGNAGVADRLRFHDVADLAPGHEAEDPDQPAT